MNKSVREVLTRYMEDPTIERPSLMNVDWMSYLKEKARGAPSAPRAVRRMLRDVQKGKNPDKQTDLGPAFDYYNPYDYEDPSTKPEDLKDSPPFHNKYPYSPDYDYGTFNKPKVHDLTEGVLKEWFRGRERDWTSDPDEQAPAISILRKKTAASLSDVVAKDYHYKNNAKIQRARACRVTWANQNNKEQTDKGLLIFRVVSPTSGNTRLVYFQFLKGSPEQVPTRPTPQAAVSYVNYPVQLSCSCESFLFHGAQYYALNGSYLYQPGFRINPNIAIAPKPQNTYTIHVSPKNPKGKRHPGRGLNFRVCKHILAAFEFVKRMKPVETVEEYPVTGPPSKIMNAEVWKKLMKFDFTEENIKERLRQGKAAPAYFLREDVTPSVIEWFEYEWARKTDDEKIKILKTMVESPERIFFVLTKEAYLQRHYGKPVSERLIDEGYKLMERVVQPDSKLKPQQVTMPGAPTEQTRPGEGTGFTEPGGTVDTKEFLEQPGPVPATEETPPGAPKGPSRVESPLEKKPVSRKKRKEISRILRGIQAALIVLK